MFIRTLPLIAAVVLSLAGAAQFGGPYAILAKDDDGQLLDAPGPLGRYLAFRHLAGYEGGLGNIHLTSMLVDGQGTYWLGTRTGLLRIDGTRHERFLHDQHDSTSLPNDLVTDLAADPDGYLWVGTWNGLYRLDPQTGKGRRSSIGQVHGGRSQQIISLFFERGLIWCTTWGGVFAVDPATFTYRQILPSATVDRPPYKDGAFATALAFPVDGSDPVIGTTHGVLRIAPDLESTRPFHPPGTAAPVQPTVIFPARNGQIWCYDRRREMVLLMDSVNGVVDSLPLLHGRNSHHQLLRIHEEDNGLVWITFLGGDVYAVDMTTRQAYRLHFGPVAGNSDGKVDVASIVKDPRGRLWFGSNAGAIVLLPSDPRLVSEALPQHDGHAIMCMIQDPAGNLMVGTRGDGVRWRDAATGAWHVARNVDYKKGTRDYGRQNTIFAIEPLDRDRYAVATLGGLSILQRGGHELRQRPVERPYAGIKSFVAACRSPNGHLWLSSMSNGVLELDTGDWRVLRYFQMDDSLHHLPAYTANMLKCAPDGTVWAGLFDTPGLARLFPGGRHFEPIDLGDGGELPALNAFGFVPPSTVVASTQWGGAAFIDLVKAQVDWIGVADGLPGPQVRSIVSHPDHGTWIGGTNGVARLTNDGKHALTHDIRLRGDHYSGMLLIDTLSGMLWIGDASRLLALDLDRALVELETPRVRLHGIRLNGEPVADMRLPVLRAEQDRLVFEISVQDPILAPRTRIAYRMLPNEIWDECVGCGQIVFGEIPAGNHRLELRAMDVTGDWGPTTTALEFTVRPKFWKTWWSRLLLVNLAIIVALAVFRWRLLKRTTRLRAQYERERLIAEERLRIANDLHDELGSGLSVIKVKSELALERPEWNPPQETLRQVAESSTDLIHAMRQMIWTIRSGQARLSDLIAYIRGYSVGYLSDHGVACTFEAAPFAQDHELSAEVRRAILLIVKEALHNVVKHAEAHHVRIDVHNKDGLTIQIADNGRGYNKGTNNGDGGGVGLESMRLRAISIGGTLLLKNEVGTTVVLHVPLVPGPNVPW